MLFVVLFSIGVDSVYAEIEMGDGMILERELTIGAGGGGISGETITITQVGIIDFALGIFTDLNAGQIDSDELVITPGNVGVASQNVIITDGVNTAEGFFNDLNGNTSINTGEITITRSDSFPNGLVNIDAFGNTHATAFFQDFVRIEDGELTITHDGSGYVDGTVTLTGNTSFLVNTAQFLDTAVCSVPGFGTWNVTFDCTISSNAVAPANVAIHDSSLITILNGVTFDIDFENFNLTINSGSGVLIKAGGKIT